MSPEEAFLRHRSEQGITESTLAATRHWLSELADFCRAEELAGWQDLTPAHLQRFHRRLLWRPAKSGRLYAANSVMQGLWAVRTFLRWAHGQGYLLEDPTRELLLTRPTQPARSLLTGQQLDSLRLLLDRSRPLGRRDAALFELLGQLTVPEVLGRDLADVLPGGRLRLPTGQVLLLEDRATQALGAYLQRGRPALASQSEEKALFLSSKGRRLGPERVSQLLLHLGRRAGLKQTLGPRRLLQSARALADEFQRPLAIVRRQHVKSGLR